VVKVDDRIIVYGYVKESLDESGPPRYAFFNGAQMQVFEVEDSYGCTILRCRHFDLNEGTIRDYFMHENQVRKEK
jgi:hypothetical protein